jgi:hypothetical protein
MNLPRKRAPGPLATAPILAASGIILVPVGGWGGGRGSCSRRDRGSGEPR